MPSLSIHLFGPVQIIHAGAPIATITSPKIQALVAYLALESRRAHPRGELAELLWPERPPGIARQNLRQALSRLNRALGGATSNAKLLTITRQTVQFNPQIATVDVQQFLEILKECQHHAHPQLVECRYCCTKLATAAALYQGEFVAGLLVDSPAFDEWATLNQARLSRLALDTLEMLAEHHLARQEFERAHQYAWRQTELDPLREGAHRQLMQALALTGRRDEALAHYERCRQILHNELDAEPAAETTALWEQLKAQEKLASSSALPVSSSFCLINFPPQHTPFIGREGELTAIGDLLGNPDCHLLTLLGYGGIGKTRLALQSVLQSVQERVDELADGAAFLALAPLVSAHRLPVMIAELLGLTFNKKAESSDEQRAELLTFLGGKSMLLLLDNAEHLLDDTQERSPLLDLIVDILQAAPNVKILVTSRQRLHLRAEWIFDVEGLNYPASDSRISDAGFQPDTFAATALFVQATRRIRNDFSPTAADARAIAHICQMVEGAPLALELAAGWAREMACAQIGQQIAESLDFLATTMRDVPERHRSVRAIFESTWAQLGMDLRQVCARLSLFRGPFSAEAAQAVIKAGEEQLALLMDRSLLRASAAYAGAERYEMHELLRQYAYEKLCTDAALLAETELRYGTYFTTLVDAQVDGLYGSALTTTVATIHEQIANIRAAWQWSISACDSAAIGRASHGLLRYYTMTNQIEEAIGAFGDGIEALQAAKSEGVNSRESAGVTSALADLLALRARAFFKLARYPEAIAHAQEAWALATQCNAGDGAERTALLASLYWGISLMNQGKQSEARAKLQECLTLARETAWPKLESDSLRALGILADREGALDEAEGYYEQSLTIGREIDDARGSSACLGNLGALYRQQGDFERAQHYLTQSLQIHQQIEDRSSEGRTLSMLGDLAVDLEEYDIAEERFRQAYEFLTEIREHHYAADALVGLGKAYAHLGRDDEAMSLWKQALACYEETGEMAQVAEVQGYLTLYEESVT